MGQLSDSRAVCVLGMHRSGTSMITSLLEPLGVHLGVTDDLRDDAAGDPHGYWEHRPLKAISEDLLHRLGADWHRPPLLEAGWERDPALDDLRASARRALDIYMGGQPLWGWKDPRTSITLPFWEPLLPDTRYVVCLRHPIESARSLAARDALPLPHGLRLWLAYTAGALVNTSGRRRLLLFYEDALADPPGALDLLARFLDRPAPDGEAAVRVTPERRRQRAEGDAAEAACPETVRALFAVLRELVGPRGLRSEAAGAVLDATAAAAIAAQQAEDVETGQAGWLAMPTRPASVPASLPSRLRARLGL